MRQNSLNETCRGVLAHYINARMHCTARKGHNGHLERRNEQIAKQYRTTGDRKPRIEGTSIYTSIHNTALTMNCRNVNMKTKWKQIIHTEHKIVLLFADL